ncbi:hypothetical protein I4641_00005 [Waterburya agarophytonicola K14]|uniref:Uncharacterized protein n=1 Tax=Waterburya agarophytonicola KI4 TaxID=2874699 RepID=A0A964FE12_9CYAN|nr:hypothetical protein [Waterburya agarophytonicola]MCC0175362.1 hypothetical protein [Waterburya agarophytonicola KI4]
MYVQKALDNPANEFVASFVGSSQLNPHPKIHLSLGRKPPATQGEECLLR